MAKDTIKLPSGATIKHGQLFAPVIGEKKRTADPRYDGRSGGKAKGYTVEPTFGAKRVTKGNVSPYHHGVAVEDEPLATKAALNGQTVPIHDGMGSHVSTRHERGWGNDPSHASSHLGAASVLGNPNTTDHDTSHISHKVHGGNRLPPSKHRTDK
jgi:hypothetical protein